MSTVSSCSEIVESPELSSRQKMNELIVKRCTLKPGQVFSVEDDINKLFEAMEQTLSARNPGLLNQVSKDSLRKRAMKRPMGSCSKIRFSDSTSLKEAFRGLSISHASKRLCTQVSSSRGPNSVLINKKNLVDISLVPEASTSKFPETIKTFPNYDLRNRKTSLLADVDRISQSQDKIEFSRCPGGDMRALQKKQPDKRFPEKISRFYVAEVILALENLHSRGIVYRDLKPDNVLLNKDGHIMLSNFDFSLKCLVSPTVLESSRTPNHNSGTKSGHPLCCFRSTYQVPCFTFRLVSAKLSKQKADVAAQVSPLPHEYLAPEIIRGDIHGSAVDWWTLGIFIYELTYGKTPFKGSNSEDTLSNIVSSNITFPDFPNVSPYTRDLIYGLLEKDPKNRLGSVGGASEIKEHLFFKGLNWALIR